MVKNTDPRPLVSTQRDTVSYYKRRLSGSPGANGALESIHEDTGEEVDLSSAAISDRLALSRDNLYTLIHNDLARDDPRTAPALEVVASQLIKRGEEALGLLAADDAQALCANPALLDGLEGIVRTDGSRPSFMIRDGRLDTTTSPVGAWGDSLTVSGDLLKNAIACVGRIDTPQKPPGYQGTGFLVGENVILTNRHVLQSIATLENDGLWKFSPGAAIDFGHEFRGHDSLNRRALKRVLFSGSKPMDTRSVGVEHTKLDLALIELEPGDPQAQPLKILSVEAAADWPYADLPIYILGYPAAPKLGSQPFSLLELLFQSTFGCKRLAPGLIMASQFSLPPWSQAHDATTLGGNSGSVVLVAGREYAAACLHYGGRVGQPLENWGHVLGAVLHETDGKSPQTLQDHLLEQGVELRNRVVGNSPVPYG